MRIHKNILGGGHLLGVSGAILALLLGVMLFPTTPDAVQAEEVTESSPRATTSVGLTVPATIEFADVMPTPSGATTTASAEIGVTTTASAGYKLYVYAEDNSLKSLNPQTPQTIAATAQKASEVGALENNTWCYNLFDSYSFGTSCAALPATNTTPIQTKDTSATNSANDTYILYLGAKVDSTIPSGTYTSTITISVVAEPAILAFEGIETMQEMTSIICSNADEGETARLKDARDDKLYWVTKLKDGNCWMTQNLDLDLKASESLTSADSDISESRGSWTPTDTQDNTTGFSSSDYYNTQSFDPGMYVNNNPTAWTTCNNYWSGGSCSNWTEVPSMTAMTEERTDGTIIDGNTYDAHYLAGNYYQWNAATAGTGGSDVFIQYQDATDSICPKGWKLPTGGNSNLESFGGLTRAYSLSGSAGATALTEAPLYFIPAGYVGFGSLLYAGSNGYYWSSTAVSSNSAYDLSFNSRGVYPSNYDYRYYVQSVRCLAR